MQGLPPDAIREAERHLQSCVDCSRKVAKYRRLVNGRSIATTSEGVPAGTDCPKDDVDWHEVAAGLWPELKARQLILHAALCDHCGPLLRAAVPMDNAPAPQEANLQPQRETPSPRSHTHPPNRLLSPRQPLIKWLIPAMALAPVIVAVLLLKPATSALSGPKFAQFAVSTHKQHSLGNLTLGLHSDSMQTINAWFQTKLQFPLVLPASPAAPGEERPYRLEGAGLVKVRGKTAAYLAYRTPKGAASLIVIPESAAIASGGVEVDFTTLSFHYSTVEGYKVVTWSAHGLTYALVSEEGNGTQQSCMVCHSSMRDRDLSQTPAPLHAHGDAVGPVSQ